MLEQDGRVWQPATRLGLAEEHVDERVGELLTGEPRLQDGADASAQGMVTGDPC